MEENVIKEILLKGSYVTAEDMKKAEDFAKAHHASVIDYFLSQGLLTRDIIGQAIAEAYEVPYADLNSKIPVREQVLKIPEASAKKWRIVLFNEESKKVTITTDDPAQKGLTAELKKLFKGKDIDLSFSLPEDIDAVFVNYRKALETRFAQIIQKQKRVAPEITDEIVNDAVALRASDIHFEPQEKEIVVRFRIDGVLFEAGRIPKEYYENILNRIKVSSRMRIDEHFSAQDGSIRYNSDRGVVDMRISVLPTIDGEKVAIRLLAEYVRSFTLGDLGLSVEHQKLLLEAADKPFGMIIVTGPTGSGKTTTLYALVKFLNTPDINITSIEDPVEYKIIGVNQTQVNAQTNLTFAHGLRAIVRQDPDVILVGEVRDTETAEIAVNAALTGHLLFSTFHANDAPTAIPRFLDMKVEPFLLASTLELIIAQRLTRKICDSCRVSASTTVGELEKIMSSAKHFFPSGPITLYKGKGCNICNNTGYKGRTAIFEFLNVTKEIRELILSNPSSDQVWDLARKKGARSLFEDGIEKVKAGITTLEELLRVAQPPKNLLNHINNERKEGKE